MRAFVRYSGIAMFLALLLLAGPSLGATAKTQPSKTGLYVATDASPDGMITEQQGKVLVAKGATVAPDRTSDAGKVRVASKSGGTVIFVGRSTGWGCVYTVSGVYEAKGGGKRGEEVTYAKVWTSTFDDKADARLALEVNGDGLADDVITLGDNTGTARVTLIHGGEGDYSVTVADSAGHVTTTQPAQPIVLTTTTPAKDVSLNGSMLGIGTLAVACSRITTPPSRDVTVAEVVISDVVRGPGMPFSISPTDTRVLTVTFSSDLEGQTVTFKVIGGNHENGKASLQGTAPVTLTQSGTITLQGGTGAEQTVQGRAGKLHVEATVGVDTVVGKSSGFSVCAHPNSVTCGNKSAFETGGIVGMNVTIAVGSDSGQPTDLGEVWFGEAVSPSHDLAGSYANVPPRFANVPPFGQLKSGVPVDYHGDWAHVLVDIFSNYGGAGSCKVDQVYLFYCPRCGMAEGDHVAIPDSGFEIIHRLAPLMAGMLKFTVEKQPKDDVAVEGFTAKKGATDGELKVDIPVDLN